MRRLTEEARQKGTLAAREARKKAPSRREKMARYAQTFARQWAEYGIPPAARARWSRKRRACWQRFPDFFRFFQNGRAKMLPGLILV
jgi:hypothetical protein